MEFILTHLEDLQIPLTCKKMDSYHKVGWQFFCDISPLNKEATDLLKLFDAFGLVPDDTAHLIHICY